MFHFLRTEDGADARAGVRGSSPAGGRDILPPDAGAERRLVERVLVFLELRGFTHVTPNLFERQEFVERAQRVDPQATRIFEAHDGSTSFFRPDITPQIARLVATSLRHRPPPWRLCGSGLVQERGRIRRRIAAEHIGDPSTTQDVSHIALLSDLLDHLGVKGVRFELSHAVVVRTALLQLPAAIRGHVASALSCRDGAQLRAAIESTGSKGENWIGHLLELFGSAEEILARGERLIRDPVARHALDELERLFSVVYRDRPDIARKMDVDLAATPSTSYYTGVGFTAMSTAAAQPIAVGGRYDGLLATLGHGTPAIGFAIDVTSLGQALGDEKSVGRPGRVLAVGCDAATVEKLRSAGVCVAEIAAASRTRALEYCRAWEFDAMLLGADKLLFRVSDGKPLHLGANFEGVPDWIMRTSLRPAAK